MNTDVCTHAAQHAKTNTENKRRTHAFCTYDENMNDNEHDCVWNNESPASPSTYIVLLSTESQS